MRDDTCLKAIAAAHNAGATVWDAGEISVSRMAGGYNNILYRVNKGEPPIVCKLCVPDERRRAWREYETLRVLRAAGLDLAPEPLWLDESCTIAPYPAVVYRWLEGESLGPALSDAQLAALLDSLQAMHTLAHRAAPHLPDTILHWFAPQPYLAELQAWLDQYGSWLAANEVEGTALLERLAHLAKGWAQFVAEANVPIDRASVPLRLCRADTNLANAVWGADGHVRWVDWEYTGWGDPALELAETHWHASMTNLTAEQHTWLRQNYRRPSDDANFEKRLAVWDRLITTRWAFLILRTLWSTHNGPDRLRLNQVAADPAQLRARLIHFVERAERIQGQA